MTEKMYLTNKDSIRRDITVLMAPIMQEHIYKNLGEPPWNFGVLTPWNKKGTTEDKQKEALDFYVNLVEQSFALLEFIDLIIQQRIEREVNCANLQKIIDKAKKDTP